MDPTTKAFDSIKPFSGTSTENSRDWCDRAEIIFNAFNVNDADRLARIGIKLDESAFDWYRDHRGPYATWNQFRQTLERTFPPPARTQNRHLLAEQINQRKQSNDESVHDYFYALDKLCREYDPHMSAIDKTIKLVGGLRPKLKEKILPLNVQTPDEFMQHAKNFESSEKVMAEHFLRTESIEVIEPSYTFDSSPYPQIATVRSTHQSNAWINTINEERIKSSMEKPQRQQQQKQSQEIVGSRNPVQSFFRHRTDQSSNRYERIDENRRPNRYERIDENYEPNRYERIDENRRSNLNQVRCFQCKRLGHIQRDCANHLNDYKDQ